MIAQRGDLCWSRERLTVVRTIDGQHIECFEPFPLIIRRASRDRPYRCHDCGGKILRGQLHGAERQTSGWGSRHAQRFCLACCTFKQPEHEEHPIGDIQQYHEERRRRIRARLEATIDTLGRNPT